MPYRDPERQRAASAEYMRRRRAKPVIPVNPDTAQIVNPLPKNAMRQSTIRDLGYQVMGKALVKIDQGLDDGSVKPVPAFNAGSDAVALMDPSLKVPQLQAQVQTIVVNIRLKED